MPKSKKKSHKTEKIKKIKIKDSDLEEQLLSERLEEIANVWDTPITFIE